MHIYWNEVASFTRETELFQKPLTVQIKVETTFDDSDPLDMDFESDEQREEYAEKFRDGTLENLIIRVSAHALGEEGSDVLGGCHIAFKQDV